MPFYKRLVQSTETTLARVIVEVRSGRIDPFKRFSNGLNALRGKSFALEQSLIQFPP